MITRLRKPKAYRHKRYGSVVQVTGYDLANKRVYYLKTINGEQSEGMLPSDRFKLKYERVE